MTRIPNGNSRALEQNMSVKILVKLKFGIWKEFHYSFFPEDAIWGCLCHCFNQLVHMALSAERLRCLLKLRCALKN